MHGETPDPMMQSLCSMAASSGSQIDMKEIMDSAEVPASRICQFIRDKGYGNEETCAAGRILISAFAREAALLAMNSGLSEERKKEVLSRVYSGPFMIQSLLYKDPKSEPIPLIVKKDSSDFKKLGINDAFLPEKIDFSRCVIPADRLSGNDKKGVGDFDDLMMNGLYPTIKKMVHEHLKQARSVDDACAR